MSDSLSRHVVFTINNQEFKWDDSDQNIVTVTDRGGHCILYNLFEGVYFAPFFSTSNLKQVRGFKMRSDDIYFTGYPRSGTHWTHERMAMLIQGKAETISKFKEHIELLPEKDFLDIPSPRIISSHIKMSDSPNEILTKKCKVVYSMRDPKDVAVSLFSVYSGWSVIGERYWGNFGDFLHLFINGTVDVNGLFEHCRDAEKYFDEHPEVPVYVHIYEDSRKDPGKVNKELSDFLGLRCDDDLCQAIAKKCEFSKMKVDKEDYSMKCDGENFLYRKGIAGDWKNWFTEEMLDDYYKVYEKKMAGSRFYHRYSRNATCS